jgi:hypothetical protein
MLRLMLWGKRRAPLDMRRAYYGGGPIYFWELSKVLWREAWRGVSSTLRVIRDAHYSRGRA